MAYRVDVARNAEAELEQLYLWVVERAPLGNRNDPDALSLHLRSCRPGYLVSVNKASRVGMVRVTKNP